MLGDVADNVAMRFQVPISLRTRIAIILAPYPVRLAEYTTTSYVGERKKRHQVWEEIVALIHSFGPYRLCFLTNSSGFEGT